MGSHKKKKRKVYTSSSTHEKEETCRLGVGRLRGRIALHVAENKRMAVGVNIIQVSAYYSIVFVYLSILFKCIYIFTLFVFSAASIEISLS